MISNQQLEQIFQKTRGHCHFCGDRLALNKYAASITIAGAWEIDHVIQRKKGGKDSPDNYLPACIRCNRLRWHRKGNQLRELIYLGLIAKDEIKKRSSLGKMLVKIKSKRQVSTSNRRRKPLNTNV